MTNFLAETLTAITESGHSPDVITFIGSLDSGHRCTWAEFVSLADFDYDEGFGAAHIATDLRIVFADSQTMWRGEYDGSEWWNYSQSAVLPEASHPIRSLGGGGTMWDTLAEIDAKVKK